ncbi:MAG: NADH-quinone oxidoreductase subunit N [Thermoleophilia bacterium]|nr:NADH-quinone oxidoreductase subunit N [Thermoleophilia bacterium]
MSFDKPTVDWLALSPELIMLGAGAVCLLGAVMSPGSWRRPFGATVCALGFLGAGVAAAFLFAESDEPRAIVADAARRDQLAALAKLILAGCGLLAVGTGYSRRMSDARVGEYYALIATAAAGMAFFVSANNLMTLFLGLEWFSIALYVLCAIDLDREESLEAGLKYLIVGGFGSAVLLFGSALVYGATGELGFERIAAATGEQGLTDDSLLVFGLALMLAGLGFKASAAPFHMWTPDVYQGAPTPVTAFMSAATKVAALVVTLRVLTTAFPELDELWTVAVAVIACFSLAVGNLAALVQRDVKRLLAYSSVSHAGFMLIAIAANNELGGRALLYYLIPYAAMSIGAFAVVAARERELGRPVALEDLAGFGWEQPLLGLSMFVFMIGFAGLPLTGGFFGKLYAFAAAYEAGWWWLMLAGVAATVISLYYYLGVIRAMYMRPSAELQFAAAGGSPPREWLLGATVLAAVVVTVGSFFAVEPVVDVARDAAASLPLD